MLVSDISITLNDGRAAILRNPHEEDIEAIIAYFKTAAGETDFLIKYPEEYDDFTYERAKEYINHMNSSAKSVLLVCDVDGVIAGNCEINGLPEIKRRHRADVGIALLREYWNLGIGTKMFVELIRIAKEMPEITQLELEFSEGNVRARHLYEKMGFKISCVHADALLLKDGTCLNEYVMTKKLQREGS